MRILWLALVMLILAIGCGDAADIEEPAPETRDVEVMSVKLWGPHYWNQIETLTFSLNGHDFAREDVHKVVLYCEVECRKIINVTVFSQGNEVLSNTIFGNSHDSEIVLPLNRLVGVEQTIELSMSAGSRPIILSVIAKILK